MEVRIFLKEHYCYYANSLIIEITRFSSILHTLVVTGIVSRENVDAIDTNPLSERMSTFICMKSLKAL